MVVAKKWELNEICTVYIISFLCLLSLGVVCVLHSGGQWEAESEVRGGAREGVGVAEGEEPDGSTASTVTVEEVLAQLGLESCLEAFQKEQIDFDSLVSWFRLVLVL